MKKIMMVFSIVLLTGCGPEITIHSPTEGQGYLSEATIHIDATITDNDGIKRVSYKLYSFQNATDIMLDSIHPTTYELNEIQTMYNLSGGNTTLKIEAEDMGGNVTNEQVTIHQVY